MHDQYSNATGGKLQLVLFLISIQMTWSKILFLTLTFEKFKKLIHLFSDTDEFKLTPDLYIKTKCTKWGNFAGTADELIFTFFDCCPLPESDYLAPNLVCLSVLWAID